MPSQRILQSHTPLTLSQHPRLPRNVSQMTNDLLIALLETIQRVGDLDIFTEIHN